MKYSDKLKDPRWQRRRLEILSRDSFTCLACGDKKATLHVHHKEYHGNPWEAPLSSLETLCEKCHEKRTMFNKMILSMKTETTNILREFIITKHGADHGDARDKKDLKCYINDKWSW